MPCRPINLGGGSYAIVCGRGPKPKPCASPGCTKPSVALCDWRLHKLVDGKREYTGKTCDAPMCEQHRNRVGTDKDLCAPHLTMARAQGVPVTTS